VTSTTPAEHEVGEAPGPFAARRICLALAKRDEARSDRPDITGRDLTDVASGYGIHHCSGASHARLEANVAVAVTGGRLEGRRPAPGDAPRWTGAAAASQSGLGEPPVRFDGAGKRADRS
jgi:cytochrome P450